MHLLNTLCGLLALPGATQAATQAVTHTIQVQCRQSDKCNAKRCLYDVNGIGAICVCACP
ncbi:hypothetical protein WAI453_004040 [Rhynchosporium graminicola]